MKRIGGSEWRLEQRTAGSVNQLWLLLGGDRVYGVENPECPPRRQKPLDNQRATGTFKVMIRSFVEIAEEALALPPKEQLRLARTLLEKAEASGDVGAEAAWDEEIERRIQKIDAGLAKGRPFPDVLRDLDRQRGR